MRRALFPPILKTVQPSTRSACGNTSRNSAIERKFLPRINLYQCSSADLVFGCFCAKSLSNLYGPVRIVFYFLSYNILKLGNLMIITHPKNQPQTTPIGIGNAYTARTTGSSTSTSPVTKVIIENPTLFNKLIPQQTKQQ